MQSFLANYKKHFFVQPCSFLVEDFQNYVSIKFKNSSKILFIYPVLPAGTSLTAMSKKHRFLTWASFFFPIPADFPVFSRFFSQETLRDENWAQNDSNLRVRAHWAEPVSQQEWQWLSNYANDSALLRWGEKYFQMKTITINEKITFVQKISNQIHYNPRKKFFDEYIF